MIKDGILCVKELKRYSVLSLATYPDVLGKVDRKFVHVYEGAAC